MLKEEFDKLTGVVSDDEEYLRANAAYEAARVVDKEVFCSEYMKAKCTITSLVIEYSNLKSENSNLRKKLYDKENEYKDLCHQRMYLGRLLLQEADAYLEESANRKAILEEMNSMFSMGEMILLKMKVGVALTSSEFEYAEKILKKE